MLQKIICWVMGAVVAVGIISNVSGCRKTSSKRNTVLRLTFVDSSSDERKPVAGVVVVLYETDNITIRDTKTTESDGVADFGDIGRTTATITYGWEYIESGITYRRLITWREGPVLRIDVGVYVGVPAATPTLINVTLTSLPDDTETTWLQPVWLISLNGAYVDVPISSSDRHNDGTVSFIGHSENDTESTKYGYLLNQTISSGSTYSFPIDKEFGAFTWKANEKTEEVWMRANYKEVDYAIGWEFPDEPADSGEFGPMDAFPVTTSSVYAENPYEEGTTWKHVEYRYGAKLPPEELEFEYPDYNFSSASFTSATKTASWALNGASPKDVVFWQFEQEPDPNTQKSWLVTTPPDTTGFSLPALPAPIDWFVWGTPYNQALLVVEDSQASGYADYIRWAAAEDFLIRQWGGGTGTGTDGGDKYMKGEYVFPTALNGTSKQGRHPQKPDTKLPRLPCNRSR